jgi:hypothetical protein
MVLWHGWLYIVQWRMDQRYNIVLVQCPTTPVSDSDITTSSHPLSVKQRYYMHIV